MDNELYNQAVEIRDETSEGKNTAIRVGRMLVAMAQNLGLKIEPSSISFVSDISSCKIRFTLLDNDGNSTVQDLDLPIISDTKSGVLSPNTLATIKKEITDQMLTSEDLDKKIDTRFGYQRATANTDEGTYEIEAFASAENADLYDSDPSTYASLLLNKFKILMGSGSGSSTIIYKLRCINNLSSLSFSIAKGNDCFLNFTFTSVDSDGNNTNEGGTCHLFVKNSLHPSYTEVESFNVTSNTPISHDVSKFLSDGSNNVMIKIEGEVSEMTTTAVIYTVTLTTLSLDISSFQWWTAKLSDFVLPCLIAGNVKKSLKITIDGGDYHQQYSVDLGTTTYTDTAYNFTIEHPGIAGVFNIKAYLVNADGTIQTKTSEYNVMCRIAGDTSKLLVVNNVAYKLVNWSDNIVLNYALCDGDNQESNVQFKIKRDSDILYSTNDQAQTGIKYSLLYTMEVESEESNNFNVTVDASDNINSLMDTITLLVDNSLSFSAISGYNLFINPRTRSNTQTNYENIINEKDKSEITATWNNMNWATDGWVITNDNKKVLRILTNSKTSINTKLLKTECAIIGKTIEVKANISNVSDYSLPWFTIGKNDAQGNFIGIKIYPNKALWYTHLKHDEETLSYPLNDDIDIHLVFCVVPNTYGNIGYNTVYLYVDGKKCRAFNYENSDLFSTEGNIEIGSTGCDVDLYAIRSYDLGLSSAGVLENYMNLLPTRSDKETLREDNDIMNASQTEIDFTKVKNVKRTFVFDQPFPSKSNPANVTGTLQVIYPEDSTRNITITNVTAAGQGSTSKGYYEWNIKFTINSNSVLTFADGTTQTGGKWKIDPTQLAGTKFTAKLNWASMSQDHKCGSVNAYTDLYKKLGLTNPAITANSLVRVSVYEQPYVGFCKQTNEDGEDVYTFQGEYTWGADKGDKYCFGYDTTSFPNLICIEGSDNAPLPALYRVPWNTNRITYQVIESQNIDGWVYNGAATFDFDSGKTENISQFIPAYNLVHSCSNLISPFNGTLDELNAQVTTYRSTQYMYWIAKTDDTNYGNLYYYEAGEQLYIGDDIGNGTINLFTQLVDKGYGLLTADISGKTAAQLNTLFINARIQKAKLEWGQYWDIDDALLHDCWVELTAGTDQRAKNTYPYIFGTDTDKKVRWRVDDMDTIWPTNNQGLLTKNYSTEVGDKYEDGAPEWNGETSVFHNVLALAFNSEMKAMMARVITALEELGGATTGTDYDKLLAWYQKYYVSVKTWFPTKMINEFGRRFEIAELKYKDGSYQSDTEPIAQIVGDAMSPDLSFVKKRLVYIMSKYSLGLFSAKSSGAITVRAAGDEITYDLTPAIDLYPTVANGESIIRGDRTFAGNVRQMVINLGGSADQQNTILGSDYLTDIGDWHNKNVHGALSITGKRIKQLLLGSKTETPTITITSLTLGNCYSLKKLELSGISTLQGTLDLTNCKGLQELYAFGTNLTNISLSAGGMLSNIILPSTLQQLYLRNFNTLTTNNIVTSSAPIRLLWLENMPNVDSLSLAKSCLSTLTNVRLFNIYGSDEELTTVYKLGLLGGIDNNGNTVSKAVLSGAVHVTYANSSMYNYLTTNFPDLTITYDNIYDPPIATFVVKDTSNNILPNATVTIGSTVLTTNSSGICTYQTSSTEINVVVSKDGYQTLTSTITIGRVSQTFMLNLQILYNATFTISSSVFGGHLANCNITIGNETKTTDSSGVVVFKLPPSTYAYTISYYSEQPLTGSFTVSSGNVSYSFTFKGNPEVYKPVANGDIQFATKGSSITITGVNNTTVPTISWGDGTTTQMTGTSSYSHSYSSSKWWNISINNSSFITTLTVSSSYLYAFWSIGNSTIKNLNFNHYSYLAYVGSDVFKNDTTRTNFDNCFYYCNNLISTPTGLFDSCVNVTSFVSCFNGCISMISISANLFDTCTKVTNFASCFDKCYFITSIPTDLFKYNTAVTNFGGCFYSCIRLTSIPVDLFKYNINVTTFNSCFGACTLLASMPTNLFDTCTKVTDFGACFSSCPITSIPSDLFKYNINVTTFNSCFKSCSITSIPVDLFKYNTAVTNFGGCFQSSKITSIPVDLFKYNINVTSFSSCFSYCNSITLIPSDLFKYNINVIYFSGCFSNCSGITSIPSGLFDLNTKVNDFTSCFNTTNITAIPVDLFRYNTIVGTFNGCFNTTKITLIPSDLFKYNTAVTNFSNCFQSSNITSIPVDLFKYNTAVTNFSSCFSLCWKLTTMPDGLFDFNTKVTIFDNCFYNCIRLQYALLPNGFSNLGSYTFTACTGLQYIKTTLTTPQTIGSNSFDNTNNCPIYVPADYVNIYKAASNWSNYASRIQAIPS